MSAEENFRNRMFARQVSEGGGIHDLTDAGPEDLEIGGTAENKEINPSCVVGGAKMASRRTVEGSPAIIAIWTANSGWAKGRMGFAFRWPLDEHMMKTHSWLCISSIQVEDLFLDFTSRADN